MLYFRPMIRAAALLVCLVLTAILCLAGEGLVRLTTDLHFTGHSRNLFTQHRFGVSIGHTPRVTGVAFGQPVYTDEQGFRIPSPAYRYPSAPQKRIVILGDSVAFGPGVPEEQTFVGLLRASRPNEEVLNTAVIGYGVEDYRNVTRFLLSRDIKYDAAILVLCLNDVSHDSAQLLLTAPAVPRTFSTLERLRRFSFLSHLDEWLRDNSKLYLYLKGLATDPAARYFLADYLNYGDGVKEKLAPLADVIDAWKHAGVPLLIVVTPYEYQLREDHSLVNDLMKPQRVLGDFFQQYGMSLHDVAPFFHSSHEFLRFDPMHFSALGHQRMADALAMLAWEK